jgi:tetratricopeptide (TPR) repeat protein
MVAIPAQGRLEEQPLPWLLLELHLSGWSGALLLSRDRVGKRFLFQEGIPVFAESNLASESLGIQLIDAGKLSRSDHNKVTSHIERTGSKEGAALLELGLMKPRDLFDALKNQVRIRLVECFGWPSGEYNLDPDSQPPDGAQPFRVDVHPLLQEGLEAHWSQERVLQELGPSMERFPVRGPRYDKVVKRLRMDPASEEMLAAVDGTRTLWKVVQLARTPRSLAAAWVLDAAQALEYRKSPVLADEEPTPTFERDVEIVVEERPAAAAAERSRAAQPSSAQGGDDRAKALRNEIVAKHETLGDTDHYELLGVERDAAADAVKRAYLQAAKTYHPDALARMGLDDETLEIANRVFGEIGKAHAVLSDLARRREYDMRLETDSTDIDANLLARAETLYRKADVLIKAGNFKGALEFAAPAVDLWPEECAYQSALGWILYKKAPSEPELAREHLQTAARLDPDYGVNLFRLSVVLKDLGEDEAAEAARARAQTLGAT